MKGQCYLMGTYTPEGHKYAWTEELNGTREEVREKTKKNIHKYERGYFVNENHELEWTFKRSNNGKIVWKKSNLATSK